MADTVKLAVLIDADNAQAAMIEPLLAEIAKYGVASVKRVYGDWTLPNLAPWKKVLVEHAIQPIQQFRYTTGKNATDSALIIDAMDLLYTGRFGGFCLISSDSDFTRLASRIREAGLLVYGFGERKAPTSLVSACDRFIYLDVLVKPALPSSPSSEALIQAATTVVKTTKQAPSAALGKSVPGSPAAEKKEPSKPQVTGPSKLKPDHKLLMWLREALEATEGEQGRAHLGALGSLLVKQAPDFDPRTYGFKKLSDLLASLDDFALDTVRSADGNAVSHYVRLRKGVA